MRIENTEDATEKIQAIVSKVKDSNEVFKQALQMAVELDPKGGAAMVLSSITLAHSLSVLAIDPSIQEGLAAAKNDPYPGQYL